MTCPQGFVTAIRDISKTLTSVRRTLRQSQPQTAMGMGITRSLRRRIRMLFNLACGSGMWCSWGIMNFVTHGEQMTCPQGFVTAIRALHGQVLCYVCETDVTAKSTPDGNGNGNNKKSKKWIGDVVLVGNHEFRYTRGANDMPAGLCDCHKRYWRRLPTGLCPGCARVARRI
jgi:hypothetical protein